MENSSTAPGKNCAQLFCFPRKEEKKKVAYVPVRESETPDRKKGAIEEFQHASCVHLEEPDYRIAVSCVERFPECALKLEQNLHFGAGELHSVIINIKKNSSKSLNVIEETYRYGLCPPDQTFGLHRSDVKLSAYTFQCH